MNTERIISARARIAAVIDQYGEEFWPLFERLDDAVTQKDERAARLAAAMRGADRPVQPAIASINAGSNGNAMRAI